ncbi:hypothetical protein [Curtobacterium sp. MCJR17_043]|uniref:hypothetical protein n=1 Tax=Curtobacterium sp. MCJR17_043 TaxID=2175660 RepID=UPI0024DF6B2B|nr:hypothetical protein [Curtobacterium sp. MCJR17_043]WIB36606.1 hypothetical protein DEJ15_05755 [Curtobacterium sp. MCJR17_043]
MLVGMRVVGMMTSGTQICTNCGKVGKVHKSSPLETAPEEESSDSLGKAEVLAERWRVTTDDESVVAVGEFDSRLQLAPEHGIESVVFHR